VSEICLPTLALLTSELRCAEDSSISSSFMELSGLFEPLESYCMCAEKLCTVVSLTLYLDWCFKFCVANFFLYSIFWLGLSIYSDSKISSRSGPVRIRLLCSFATLLHRCDLPRTSTFCYRQELELTFIPSWTDCPLPLLITCHLFTSILPLAIELRTAPAVYLDALTGVSIIHF
jgi:hypothetical protein